MASPALHQFGRSALIAAWPRVTGANATLPELQIAGAVATLESGYGTFAFTNRQTGEKIRNSNNWGAVQCSVLPPCPDTCFEATDTNPNKQTSDNPDGAYQACFLHPATPADGAMAFVKQVTTRRPLSWAAMKNGDIDAFSKAMYHEHYYQGFGATEAERVNGHATLVERYAKEIAAAMGEPIVATRGGPGASGGDSGDLFTFDNAVVGMGLFALAFVGRRVIDARRGRR